jgi:hypothetical protein
MIENIDRIVSWCESVIYNSKHSSRIEQLLNRLDQLRKELDQVFDDQDQDPDS